MRLIQSNTRAVCIRCRDERAGDESVYSYQPGGVMVQVTILPTGYADSRRQEQPRLWGEVPERALVMYYSGEARIQPGQGVCVDVAPGGPCDYRVTGVEDWPGHRRAYLAYIPENRRG